MKFIRRLFEGIEKQGMQDCDPSEKEMHEMKSMRATACCLGHIPNGGTRE